MGRARERSAVVQRTIYSFLWISQHTEDRRKKNLVRYPVDERVNLGALQPLSIKKPLFLYD